MERNYGSIGYYMKMSGGRKKSALDTLRKRLEQSPKVNNTTQSFKNFDIEFRTKDEDKPKEDPINNRGTIFQFLREPLGLLALIISISSFSINLFTTILLTLALIQCKFAYRNSQQGLRKAYVLSVIGVCLAGCFCGLQIYAVASVFIHDINPEEDVDIVAKLIKSLGITMSSKNSIGYNVWNGFKCFTANIFAIVCYIWLIIFYKSKTNVDKLPPESLMWFYSAKIWICITFIAMFCSACSNISIAGLIFFILGISSICNWCMNYSMDWLLTITMKLSICLSSSISILSGLLHLALISSYISDYLYIPETIGVEMFIELNATTISHFWFTLCASVAGIFYLQISEYTTPLDKSSINLKTKVDREDSIHLLERHEEFSMSLTISIDDIDQDESFFIRLKKIIIEYVYTPIFYTHLTQILIFIWIIRLNSILSIPQIIWLMYSTLFSIDTNKFYFITKYIMFPYTMLNGIALYIVNICNLPVPNDNIEFYKLFGFLLIREDPYTIYFFEFLLVISTLVCLCFIFKRKSECALSEKKTQHFKLLKGYDTLKQVCILIVKNIDKPFIIILYLQGTESVSLLHAGIVGYFLLFFIYPASGRRCFIFLLFHLELFLASQIIYGVFSSIIMDCEFKYTIETIAVIVGIYTEVFIDAAAGRVNLRFDFIILIVIVYLQYALYNTNLYKNKKINQERESIAPLKGIIYVLLFLRNIVYWLYIWIVYVLFFIIIIISDASIINSIFLILILLVVTVHLWNETTKQTNGDQYTRLIWIVMLLYCGIIVFTLYVYQFLGIRILRMFLAFFYTPQQFGNNLYIIGYKQLKDDNLWFSLFPYFALLFLSVIGSRYVHKMQDENEDLIQIPPQVAESMDFSHFLNKIQRFWPFFDFISTFTFDFLAYIMLLFSIFWNLSLATYVLLIMICAYYLSAHLTIYHEAASPNRNPNQVPTLAEIKVYLDTTKRRCKKILISTRDKYWKILHIGFLVMMFLAYMSRFVELIYIQTIQYAKDPNEVLRKFSIVRFLALWLGFYHSESTGSTSFAFDSLGYFVLLILLLIERKSLQWYCNRLSIVDEESKEETNQMKTHNELTYCTTIDDLLESTNNPKEREIRKEIKVETIYEKELIKVLLVAISVNYYKIVYNKSSEMNYYQLLTLKATKNLLEMIILFMIMLSYVFKESVIIILYVPFLFVFLKYGSSIRVSIWLQCYFLSLLMIQYLLCLITFSYSIAPQTRNYSTIDQDCTQTLIAFSINGICPLHKNWDGWDDWANYLELGSSSTKLTYLIIDSIILILFSLYFRYFCTSLYELDTVPENNNDIGKVTSSSNINHKPSVITKMQFLALKDCKRRKSLLKEFVSSIKSFCLSYLHIVILCAILILATCSQGLLSIGYFLFCLVFIYRNCKYFKGDKEWKYPYWQRLFLQPYLLIDLIIQLIVEMPFENKLISKVWEFMFLIQPLPTSNGIVILKLVTIMVISLQGKILQSEEYARSTAKNLKTNIEISQLKGLCCTYLYNNKKIYQHMKYEQRKVKNHEKLEKVKEQVKEWSKKLKDSDSSHTLLQLKEVSPKRCRSIHSVIPVSPEAKTITIQLNKIEMILKDKRELRKNAIKNWAGILGRFYIWMYSKIDHVLFKNGSKLEDFFTLTKSGATNLPSCLERMVIECEELKLRVKKEKLEEKLSIMEESKSESKLDVGNIKKLEGKYKKIQNDIKSFTKFSHILRYYWRCFYRIILSSTNFYCYLSMILAQLFNGSILSVVYPLSLFLYCLVEHCRPHWVYWTFILLYTEIVLAMKFVIQLNAINYWIIDKKTLNSEYLLNSYRLGLKVFDSTLAYEFLLYILFEALIILSVLIHQYVLIFSGIHEKREVDQETILEAIDRITKQEKKKVTIEELKTDRRNKLRIEDDFNTDRQLIINNENTITDNKKINKPNVCTRFFRYIAFENSYSKTIFPLLKVIVIGNVNR